MQFRFLQAGDTAEEVLHTAGEGGHAVGFELAHRNQQVGLCHRVDDGELSHQAVFLPAQGGEAGVLVEGSSALPGGLGHAAGFVDAVEQRLGVGAAGAVRNGDAGGAPVQQQPGGGFHHQRMGGGGLLGAALHQQVGLEQHGASGHLVRGKAALAHHLFQRRDKAFPGVVRSGGKGDGVFRFTHGFSSSFGSGVCSVSG